MRESTRQKLESRISKCTLCKQYKSFDDFYPNASKSPFYIATECKQCMYDRPKKTNMHRPTDKEIKERLETQVAICSKCKNNKSFLEFYKDKRNSTGLMAHCKNCEQERTNKKRDNMMAKMTKEEKLLYNRIRSLHTNFKLTIEQYNQMLKEQNYVCKICKKPEQAKCNHNKDKIRNLAVDHCHKTGRIRGLLCGRCNTSIGKFEDNEEYLLSAAIYLEEYKELHRQQVIQECIDIIIENNKEINNDPS